MYANDTGIFHFSNDITQSNKALREGLEKDTCYS